MVTEVRYTSQEKSKKSPEIKGLSLPERYELLLNNSRSDKRKHLIKLTEAIVTFVPIYNHIFPSEGYLADKVDVTEMTIGRLTRDLRDYGIIERKNCGFNSVEYNPHPGFFGEHREYFAAIFKVIRNFVWLISCLSNMSHGTLNVNQYSSSSYYKKENLYTTPARNTHWDKDSATHTVKALPRQIFIRLLGTGKGLSIAAFRHKIRTTCRDQFPKFMQYLWNSPDVCESQLLFLLLHVDTLRILDMPEWVTPHPNCGAPSPHGEIVARLIGYIKKVVGSSNKTGKAKYALMKRCLSVAGFEYKKREVVRVEKIKKLPMAPVYSHAKEEHTRDFYKQLLHQLTSKGYVNA